jgi:tetratricopeptide (TPR) repeat protein
MSPFINSLLTLQHLQCYTPVILMDIPQDLMDLRKRIRHNRNDAVSLHAAGAALAARGEFRRSYVYYRAAALSSPQHLKYQCSCAGAALSLGYADDARWHVDRALAIDPGYAEAWQIRGLLYLDTIRRPDEALRSYIKAIELAPDDLMNYQSAARCLVGGNADPVAAARAIEAFPSTLDPVSVKLGVAMALSEEGFYEEAIPMLHDVLRVRPDDSTAIRRLAELYTGLRDWPAAQFWFEKGIAAGKDPLVVIGCLLHWSRLGDFERAKRVYRSHMQGEDFEFMLRPASRRWQGQDIRGKTLLLNAGDIYYGDALQFARFARIAKQAGARVIVQVPKRIRSLVRTMEGVDAVVAPYDSALEVDFHANAFWLIYALDIPMAEMIGKTPYLQAPADLRAEWRKRIPHSSGMNVGIVWRGSPYFIRDRFGKRTMALEELRPLTGIPGVTLYSLQCGEGRAELRNANPPFPAIDLAPDFPNTAAAIEALDLVVTIDTSIAHLAGALGKRTFMMLPYNACFRWMVNRGDTDWYPAMKLLRQTRPGVWSDVVSAVARALT